MYQQLIRNSRAASSRICDRALPNVTQRNWHRYLDGEKIWQRREKTKRVLFVGMEGLRGGGGGGEKMEKWGRRRETAWGVRVERDGC
ncbi:hypothetical protein CEXT_167361 [Caerostris extrusa]|uniref:Uncharacterized protein n=1 Tax=Caerostris extrusa TaxID=172846 RepID=A0AAV4W5N8_CAEEX|nr:hypothetical protein CEXT_167361 [Caerostris extrusa]